MNGDLAGGDVFFDFAFVSDLGCDFFLLDVGDFFGVLTGVLMGVLTGSAGLFFGVSFFLLLSFSLPGEISSCFTTVLVDFRFVGGDLKLCHGKSSKYVPLRE